MYAYKVYGEVMSAPTKPERLAMRLTAEQKAAIESAASVLGQSITEFAVQTAVERAHEVLADQRVFYLPADQVAEFDARLNAPVAPNPGLERLFAKPSILRDDL